MARFKTVKTEFVSLPNDVVQGFYLSANAIAVLITCLSYPDDWVYRPISIWKSLKLSRDKTYKAFDELVEKGHCIRIRTKKGNLRAEVDYIFFDQIKTCQSYIESNHKELSASNIEVGHKWNFKNVLRHPEPRNTGDREPEGQEVLKKMGTKKIDQKRSLKESIRDAEDVHNSTPSDNSTLFDKEDSIEPDWPEERELKKALEEQLGRVEKDLKQELQKKNNDLKMLYQVSLSYFRQTVLQRWIKKYGPEAVVNEVKFFIKTKETQKNPIQNSEAWMEKALEKQYDKTYKTSLENKAFAEKLKKEYRLGNLKINKRYCKDTATDKDYYYNLPKEAFKVMLSNLIT